MTENTDSKTTELTAEPEGPGIDFWLKFPIRVRPLKFVPGRNRREKRVFRALAARQERGTITTTKPGRGGGQLKKLHALYTQLAAAGVLKQTAGEETKS